MADLQITNCHIHTFTMDHVPAGFPNGIISMIRTVPALVSLARRLAGLVSADLAGNIARYERLLAAGNKRRQAHVMEDAQRQYPGGTRYVVLPMDMAPAGYGIPPRDLRQQHDELAALAATDPAHVIPFATLHPDAPDAEAEFKRAIETLGFKGLKIYPKLGYAPDCDFLMQRVYPYCAERGLPVMTHCSRGGVFKRSWTQRQRDLVTAPQAYLPVLQAFPDLRICLAHFGGDQDWHSYLHDGMAPDAARPRWDNWLAAILDMLASGDFPGLYTDISYTLFHFDHNAPFLKIFLENPAIRAKVLFGSDHYMTRQEDLSERQVAMMLRERLGEDVFRQIAEANPKAYLGF